MLLSEHKEQVIVFNWCKFYETAFPELKNIFAIPNGAWTKNQTVGKKLKAEGVKAGVPDLMLAYPLGGYPGLFIEMKRRSNYRISKDQLIWRQRLKDAGYSTHIAKGSKEAIQIILAYLGKKYHFDLKVGSLKMPYIIVRYRLLT